MSNLHLFILCILFFGCATSQQQSSLGETARVYDGKTFHQFSDSELVDLKKRLVQLVSTASVDCTLLIKELRWPDFKEPTLELNIPEGEMIVNRGKIKRIAFPLSEGRVYMLNTSDKLQCVTKYWPKEYADLICSEGAQLYNRLSSEIWIHMQRACLDKNPAW